MNTPLPPVAITQRFGPQDGRPMDDTQTFDTGLQVEKQIRSDSAIVRVSGPMTFPAAVHVFGVIKQVIEQRPPVVMIDLSGLETVDATGIAVLVGIGGDLKTVGIQVRIVAPDPRIRHRLPYTRGLRKVFPSVEEALQYQP